MAGLGEGDRTAGRGGGAVEGLATGPGATPAARTAASGGREDSTPLGEPGPAAVLATVRDPLFDSGPPRVLVEPEDDMTPGGSPSAVVVLVDDEGGEGGARWTIAGLTEDRLRAAPAEDSVVITPASASSRLGGGEVAARAPTGDRGRPSEAAAELLPARIDALLGPLRRQPDGREVRDVVVDGWRFRVEVEPARRAVLRARAGRSTGAAVHGGPSEVRAAIPGRVVAIAVTEGELVRVGSDLLVVEAMKMQNEVRSPRDGVVRRIAVGVGQSVELGDLLVLIE